MIAHILRGQGPDTLVLDNGVESIHIVINPGLAEEMIEILNGYVRNFERVSLIAEVNRCKQAADEAIRARKKAQAALSAFDAEVTR